MLTELLLLQSQARVALRDQQLQVVHGLRPVSRNQFLTSSLRRLNLSLIITIRMLNLAQKILLMLSRRLVTLQTKLAARLVARADTIILFRE